MTLLIGGAVSTVLGLMGLVFWGREFLIILQGAIPIALLLTGILAMYVGFDEIQEKFRDERRKQNEKLEKAQEEIEIVKAKAEEYREEIDRLKKEVEKAD
jgi:Skp family chaperone for outer membrane proteins